ncbi:uncharacterized protein LOC116769637 [Danaus plexippus]|uniref:DUF233 protein n=1 Tax=Danaus plexippus plexippus TaxID=278856 RepID=A0A212F9C7_DANPL|nr:uncharacterized protein LOC116769637 [Danaus plexippus]OWR50342.1 DUF233 protein [Danaus plexippus plexippus]
MKAVLLVFLNILQLLYISSSPLESRCFAIDTKCLTARAQENVALFVQGLPDLNIERLDPMCIDYVKRDLAGLKFEGKNLRIDGLAKSIIDEISIDMNSRLMRLEFHLDPISIQSNYKLDGNLFTIPICGEGDLVTVERNLQVDLKMPFDLLVDAYGTTFMNLKNYTYNFNVKDGGEFRLTNLYYGDQEKSDFVHNFLNNNWKAITQVFGPLILDDAVFKVYNAIATFMRSRPLNDLLL